MNRYDYHHTPERELLGRKVRTLAPLKNGWGIIPTGTIATITRKYSGFSLQAEPCPTCGLCVIISRVQYNRVELIPDVKTGG